MLLRDLVTAPKFPCLLVKMALKTVTSSIDVNFTNMDKKGDNQEPIKWSLHLSYKPLESTLSRVDL